MEGTAKEFRYYRKDTGKSLNDIKIKYEIILLTVWKDCSGYWK